MSENTSVLVQLNNYPKDKYNVLVPVTTMQVASNLQRITVSEVQLDTRQDSNNKGPSKDIYCEKSSSKFAITKVGGMKLASAANISIVSTDAARTEGCQRCIEMARATGKARVCGTCEHVYDVGWVAGRLPFIPAAGRVKAGWGHHIPAVPPEVQARGNIRPDGDSGVVAVEIVV